MKMRDHHIYRKLRHKDITMLISSRTLFWGINVFIPALIKLSGPALGLSPEISTFFALTSWAILAWIMETLPENLVAILLPAFYVVFHVGTGKQIFAPWGTSIPWLIIGGMMMGMIMMQTGLSRRIALSSIKVSGLSFTRVMIGLMLAGLIISPFVPSVMGKAAIVAVICLGICEALNIKPQTREGSAVILIGFLSVACPKLAYLTGGGDVVIAMRIAGEVSGNPISWGEYFIHNFPLAIIYGMISFALVMIVLRPKIKSDLAEFINTEYNNLGPLKTSEKKSIAIMVAMLILMATDKWHGVPAGYVLLFMGSVCFLPGVDLLNKEKMDKMNFGVIFFVLGCMCLGAGAKAAGVDTWFANLVEPMLSGSKLYSMVGIFVVGVTSNFLLTPLAALATLTGPFGQIALDIGLNPNVAAYCLIYGVDQYIFPYEFAVLLYFYATGYLKMSHLILVLGLRAILALVFLVCVATPYWNMLGIL